MTQKIDATKILSEYRAWLAAERLKVQPYVIPASHRDIADPYWVELHRRQKDNKKRARLLGGQHKTVQEAVRAYDLKYLELNPYQRRVMNGRNGQFVDWWLGRKRTMLAANGQWTHYNNEKSIIKEILKII